MYVDLPPVKDFSLGVGATIRIGQEIKCLPYAEFLVVNPWYKRVMVLKVGPYSSSKSTIYLKKGSWIPGSRHSACLHVKYWRGRQLYFRA